MMTLTLTEGAAAAAPAPSAAWRAMLAAPAYGHLPDHEKPHLKARLALMERIDAAPRKQPAIAAEALRLHANRPLSEGAIRKLYYEKWVAGGRQWAGLINRARVPAGAPARLGPETVLYWHELFFRMSGRGAAAHRVLQRAWEAGQPIPGCPTEGRTRQLPHGLTYTNLMSDKYRPTAATKRVARIGLRAAEEFLPSVLSTRVGMAPGSFLLFDDIWHDLYCSVPGQLGKRRVLQFHCLELLSGCQIGRGIKPEILGDDGKMQRLKQSEMLFLFAHVLGNRGYNPAGCLAVMELGTATLPERVVKLLHDFSGGKFKVEMGTASGNPLAAGLYGGQSKGNFKIKAALESLGNLIHNETGDRLLLPAQSGSIGRINEPEELHGRTRHLEQLQKCALLVPKDLRDMITRHVTPAFAQVVELLDLIQERMNHREEHALEGWEACGFMAPLFRLSTKEDWKLQSALADYAPALRASIEQAILADPKLITCSRLSPHEVYTQRVQPHLTTLPAHLIPELLGMELARERRVGKDGRFHFEDASLLGDEHHFEGRAINAEGQATVLPDGETYATFVSMLDPHWMHVCDARGRYVGKAPRTLVPTRGDAEGFAKACGQRTQAARERLVPVLRAAAPLIRRDAEAAEHATELLAQLGDQKVIERKTKNRSATDLLIARAAKNDDDANA